jgi:hypothetical protein
VGWDLWIPPSKYVFTPHIYTYRYPARSWGKREHCLAGWCNHDSTRSWNLGRLSAFLTHLPCLSSVFQEIYDSRLYSNRLRPPPSKSLLHTTDHPIRRDMTTALEKESLNSIKNLLINQLKMVFFRYVLPCSIADTDISPMMEAESFSEMYFIYL